jgi:hypothetical protein
MSTDADKKIAASQRRTHAVLLAMVKDRIHDVEIDYDVDTRWNTVAAITTMKYRGKSYRVTVEEVIGE